MDVSHDPAGQRFTFGKAELTYVEEGGAVIFDHTFVPPELRGQGLADRLMAAGLAWAKASGKRPEATCSFAAAYLKRHT